MSNKHFPQYREKLFVDKSEHILHVTHGNDGELYAICFHPRDILGHFPVRFTTQGQKITTVRFCSDLSEAMDEIQNRINKKAVA